MSGIVLGAWATASVNKTAKIHSPHGTNTNVWLFLFSFLFFNMNREGVFFF